MNTRPAALLSLLVCTAALLLSSAASAQSFRTNAAFSGGTLTSGLVLDATNTLCSQALSLSFSGDADLGIQRAAANTMALCVSGAAALQLSTSATFTVGAVFSGVATPDINTGLAEDLVIKAGGTSGSTGKVGLWSLGGIVNIFASTGAAAGVITPTTTVTKYAGETRVNVGTTLAVAANAIAVILGDNADLVHVHGSGMFQYVTEQVVTCAAGVASLDPQSSYISIDANGAACAVTIAETTAATNGAGSIAKIYVATSAGAGTVTFPDVAGVFNGPTLCTTTGIPEDGTMSIMYANKADDMWIATSCQTN